MFYIFCRRLYFFSHFISVALIIAAIGSEILYSSYIIKSFILKDGWYAIVSLYFFCIFWGVFFFVRGKERIPLMDSLKNFAKTIVIYLVFAVVLFPSFLLMSKGLGGILLDIEGGVPYTEEFKCGGSGRNKILGEYIYAVDKDGRSNKLYGFGRVCSNGWFGKDNTVLRATGRENDIVKSVETIQVVHH